MTKILPLLKFILCLSLLTGSVSAFSQAEFRENKGQWPGHVAYAAKMRGATVFVENQGFTFDVFTEDPHQDHDDHEHGPHGHIQTKKFAYKVKFLDAKTPQFTHGELASHARYNYFRGNDPKNWASDVQAFVSVGYGNIYPNIDIEVQGNASGLKYDYILHPGSDVADIKLAYEGFSRVRVKSQTIFLESKDFSATESIPLAYQIINGDTVEVSCQYIKEGDAIGFELGAYNDSLPLVIDPQMVFSTYTGSTADNFGFTATYDNFGFLYAGGNAYASGYPTVTGSYDTSFNDGNFDIVLSKFDTTGSFLIYSTYLGGSNQEQPHSIVVNEFGELYMFGTSGSNNFPTTAGAYDRTFDGGPNTRAFGGSGFGSGLDMVLCKLSADGSSLLSSTYLGGSDNDGFNGYQRSPDDIRPNTHFNFADEYRGEIDLDKEGKVYIVSTTYSQNFPTTPNAFQPNFVPGALRPALEGVICRFNQDLSNLEYSTFLGGSGFDALHSIAIRENDVIFAGGTTSSSLGFPASKFAFQPNFGGNTDGIFGSFNPQTGALNFISYIGAGRYDQSYFIDFDKENKIYLFGQTQETGNYFSSGNPGFNNNGGGLFVSVFNPTGTSRLVSSAVGTSPGNPSMSPTAFLVDVCQRIYISGWSDRGINTSHDSRQLPVTPDAFDGFSEDHSDQYLGVFAPDMGSLVYGTYIGDPNRGEHVDGGTSRFDKKGIVYQANCAGCATGSNNPSSGFPTTPGRAVSTTNNSNNCNMAVFKFDLEPPLLAADFAIPTPSCQPTPTVTFQNLSDPATQYKWDFGDGGTSEDENPTHTYTQPGFYAVTLIAVKPDACNISDTITKEFGYVYEGTFEIKDTTICSSASLNIGPNLDPRHNISSYVWDNHPDIADVNETNPTVTPTQDATYTLRVDIEGCELIYEYKVTVESFENDLGPDTVICGDQNPVRFETSSKSVIENFYWSRNNNFNPLISFNPPGDSIVNFAVDDFDRFYVRYESATCTYIDSIDVTRLSAPLPEDTAYCEENGALELRLAANPEVTNYTWSDDDGFANVLNSSGLDRDIEVQPSDTTTYYYRMTTPYCELIDSIQVAPFYIAPFQDSTICLGDMIALGYLIPDNPNITFNWLPHPDIPNPTDPNPIVNPSTSTSYTIEFFAGEDCRIERTLDLTVQNLNYDLTPDTLICDKEIATILEVSTLFNVQITWSDNIDFSNKLNTGNNSSISVLEDPGVYKFYVRLRSSSCETIDSVTVYIHEPYIPTEEILCDTSDFFTLTSDGLGRISNFEWSDNRDFSNLLNDNATDSSIDVSPNSTRYFYIRTSTEFCVYTDSVLVRPFIPQHSKDTLLCPPSGNIPLTASGNLPNPKVLWASDRDFNNVLNGPAEPTINVPPPNQTTTYYVRITAAGCSQTDSTTIFVHDPVLGDEIIACESSDSTLLVSDGLGFIESYEWSELRNYSSLINASTEDSAVKVRPDEATTYYIRTQTAFCTYEDSVVVNPFLVQVSPDTLVCDDNTPVRFSASSNFEDESFNWSEDPDHSTTFSTNNTINVFSEEDTKVYYLRVRANGCTKLDSARILVHDPIDAEEIILCDPNEDLNLISDGYGKINSFLWSSNRNFTDTLNTFPDDSSIVVSPAVSAWYYIKTKSDLCDYEDSVFVKRLLPAPVEDTLICDPSQPIILTADGNGVAFSFDWDTLPDFSSNPPIPKNPNDSSISVLPDETTVYYTRINTPTCAHYDSVVVYRLTSGLDTDTTYYCYPDGINIKVNGQGLTQTFTWATDREFGNVIGNSDEIFIDADSVQRYYIKFETEFCDIIDSVDLAPFVAPEFNDTTLCDGASFVLGYSELPFDFATYQWTPHPDIADINEANPSINPSAGINVYELNITAPGLNCPLAIEQIVEVTSLLDSVSPTQVFCDTNETITLTGFSLYPGNSTYKWSTDPSFSPTINAANDPSITVGYDGNPSTTYYLQVSNPECSADTSIDLVYFDPIAFEDSLVCNPDDSIKIQLNGQNYSLEYLWSLENDFSDTLLLSSDGNISLLPDSSTTYYVKIKTLTCEMIDSVSIRRYHFGLIGDSLVCDPNANLELKIFGLEDAVDIRWDTLSDFSSNPPLPTAGFDIIINVLPNVTTTYYVKVETPFCTYIDSSTLFTFDNGLADDTLILCNQGQGYTLVANSNGYADDFFWSLNKDFMPIIEGDSIFVVRPDTLTTYYLRIRTQGCIYDDSVTVSPFEIPNLKPIDICLGDNAILGPDDPSKYLFSSYNWEVNPFMQPADLVMANPNVAPTLTYNFTLNYAVKNCTAKLFQKVNVEDLNPVFDLPTPLEMCETGQEVDIQLNAAQVDAEYRFSLNPSYTPLLNSDLSNPNLSYEYQGGNESIYVQILTEAGCQFEDQLDLIPVGNPPTITSVAPYCLGDTIKLFRGPVVPGEITPSRIAWTPNEIMTMLPATGDTVYAVSDDSVTVTATFTYNSGCNLSAQTFITPSPVYFYEPDIRFVDSTLYYSQPFTVYNANPSWQFASHWEPDIITAGNITDDTVTYVASRSLRYIYLKTTDGNCTRNDSVDLSAYLRELFCGPPDIFVPNAFSPNQDGENDALRVRGRFIEKMLFRVYDRWGQLIYESTNQQDAWDGTFNGVLLNPAVYVYYLEATCTNKMKYFTKGNITLIR